MDEVSIAFVVDNASLDQVAVVIASILASSAEPAALRFFIIFDGSAETAKPKLAAWAVKPPHLTLLPVDNPFLPRTRPVHISTAALLRTQLPVLLPQLDRVLYFDADIIVRRDIAELYRSDLVGNAMGAVVDLDINMALRRELIHRSTRLKHYFERLGIDPRRSLYVNSGVLLMDLAALRRLDFSAEALAFANARGAELITMDQCLINTILSGRIAALDPRWNACGQIIGQPRRHHYIARRLQPDLRLQQADPWLIHYTGAQKPWTSMRVWRAGDWWQHAAGTGIAWAPVASQPPARRKSPLMPAWRAVTDGVSRLLSRIYPD
jgi:lipopolysaccharide biosynthesis glycosyltransferase